MRDLIETIGMFLAVFWLFVLGCFCFIVIVAFYALIVCIPLAGLLGVVYLFLKACGVVS